MTDHAAASRGLGPRGRDESGDAASSRDLEAVPGWLLAARVAVPDRPLHYLDRPPLLARCMPTDRRLTVLMAPGGFGKTTLLAACCREIADRGIPTAWLSVRERDTPAALDAYLAYALRSAGIGFADRAEPGGRGGLERTSLLLRTIEEGGEPCVLAIDELEKVADPETTALLTHLVAHAPANLHLALACRQLPVGLDIAASALDGPAEILVAEDLRFTRLETARFFDDRLSRGELVAVNADAAGWPIALRMHRNARHAQHFGKEQFVRGAIENWVESRLWSHLPERDREFLLDVGLFDDVEATLLDEVLETSGSLARLEQIHALAGLLEPVRHSGKAYRLHGLVRDHCARHRRRETPARFRRIHRRIAGVLARRGETVAAMRHAAEAEQPQLAGDILLDAGGLRLWLREGVDRLDDADRYLTEQVVVREPRLALARCAVRALTGRLTEARRLLERDNPQSEDPPGEETLSVERNLVRGVVALYGCARMESRLARTAAEGHRQVADNEGADPLVRATSEYSLCLFHNLKAEFPAGRRWAARSRARLLGRSPYFTMLLDYQLGQMAMAQGRVRNARNWYLRGLRAARRLVLYDPLPKVFGNAFMRELQFERNLGTADDVPFGIPNELQRSGTPFVPYAAASTVALETALADDGPEAALAGVDDMWEYARVTELPALADYLCALRVWLLAGAGQVSEAEGTWRAGSLPEGVAECLDLNSRSWREMEALACARVRLLEARGDPERARRLVHQAVATAEERGLVRTAMRVVAGGLALEARAGNRAAANAHVERFLRLFALSDYARPIVREGAAGQKAVEEWVHDHPESPLQATAASLLASIRAPSDDAESPTAGLTPRQLEVLGCLDTLGDKAIAAQLGLTRDGVRYHVAKIFKTLRVRNRRDAVRRARVLDLLPPEG